MSKLSLALSLTAVCTLALGCGDSTVAPATDGGPRDMTSAADLGGGVDGGMASDGGAGGDSGTAAPWEQYCTVDGPARATRCSETPSPVAECRSNAACVIGIGRADVAAAIPACLAALPCGMTDTACYTAAGAGFAPSAAATAFQTACLAKHTMCAAGPASFGSDPCYFDFAPDPVVAEFTTCLGSACGAIDACFGAILDVRAPGCF